MLNLLSTADTDEDSDNRSEIISESALVISNSVSEFDELLQNTWQTLMHNELTLTEQMEVGPFLFLFFSPLNFQKHILIFSFFFFFFSFFTVKEVNSMLERDMSDMVNVMLEQALGYFVAMRSLQESFNEQLSEASHRYLTVIADDAASITSQLCEVCGWLNKFRIFDMVHCAH